MKDKRNTRKGTAKAVPLDKQLIQAVQAGGRSREEAIKHIFEDQKLKKNIFQYILRRGGQLHDAEEIFSQAIVELDGKIRKGNAQFRSGLRKYLFGICRFLWRNRQRRNNRSYLLKEQFTTIADCAETTKGNLRTEMDKRERAEQLRDLIEQLSPSYKRILELWMLDYSMEEIAEQTGLANANTAKVYKCRAMKKLTALIENTDAWQDYFL